MIRHMAAYLVMAILFFILGSFLYTAAKFNPAGLALTGGVLGVAGLITWIYYLYIKDASKRDVENVGCKYCECSEFERKNVK